MLKLIYILVLLLAISGLQVLPANAGEIENKAIELTKSISGPLYVTLQNSFDLGKGGSTRQVSKLPSWKMNQELNQQGHATRNIFQEEASRIAHEEYERGEARCAKAKGLCINLSNSASLGWHAEFINLATSPELIDEVDSDKGFARYNFGPIETVRVLDTRPSINDTCDIWVKYRVWPIQEDMTIAGATFMKAIGKESIDQEVCYRLGRKGLLPLFTNMVTEKVESKYKNGKKDRLSTQLDIEEKPSKQDVLNYLKSVTPKMFEVSKVRYESFSGNSSGRGRISVSGNLTLKQDLYVADKSRSWLAKVAKKRNISNDSFLSFPAAGKWNKKNEKLYREYRLSNKKGAHFTFKEDLNYKKHVDGFSISGGISNPINTYNNIPANEARQRGYIAGYSSANQVVNALLKHHQVKIELKSARSAFRSKITNFLRNSKLKVSVPQKSGTLNPRHNAYYISCPDLNLKKILPKKNEDKWYTVCTANNGSDERRMQLLVSFGWFNYQTRKNVMSACMNYYILDEQKNTWNEPRSRPWKVVPFFSTVNCNFKWKDERFKSTGNGGFGGWIERKTDKTVIRTSAAIRIADAEQIKTKGEEIKSGKDNRLSDSFKTNGSAFVIAEPHLNIRASKSTSGDIVGTATKGRHVEILETDKEEAKISGKTGNWVKIKYGSTVGYVFDAFLKYPDHKIKADKAGANKKDINSSSITNQQTNKKQKKPLSNSVPNETKPTNEEGKKVYDSTCYICHSSGVAGAPVFGNKEVWEPIIRSGIEKLYNSAINGKGGMPAKGGISTLSDKEVKAAVDYMVSSF